MTDKQRKPRKTDFLLESHLRTAMSNDAPEPDDPDQWAKGHVTLFVNGTVVTGRAVKLADYFRATMIPEGAGADFDVLRGLADKFDQQHAEFEALREKDFDSLADDEKELATAPIQFINLLDARWQVGSGALAPTSESGAAIRVKASSVDAWFMGGLSTS